MRLRNRAEAEDNAAGGVFGRVSSYGYRWPVQRHGGNLETVADEFGLSTGEIIDFSVNVNPFGPPEAVTEYLKKPALEVSRYPELDAETLTRSIGDRYGLSRSSVMVGSGSAELLYWLCAYLKPKKAFLVEPGFSDYRRALEANGSLVWHVSLKESRSYKVDWAEVGRQVTGADIAILGSPNNPTGQTLDREALLSIVSSRRRTRFVVDEAFIEFLPDSERASFLSVAAMIPNLMVLRSMTKVFSIPGVRLGFLTADPEFVLAAAGARPPWPLSEAQIAIGKLALDDREFVSRTVAMISEEKKFLIAGLIGIPWLTVVGSQANFLLLRINDAAPGSGLIAAALARQGLLVRDCQSFSGLNDRYIRVAVLAREENERLLNALDAMERSKMCGS